MAARVAILLGTVFFFVPALVIVLVAPGTGTLEPMQSLAAVLTMPFAGSCPITLVPNGSGIYWAMLAGFALTCLAGVGLWTGEGKWAAIYSALLVLSWMLTAFRIFALSH